VQPFFLFPTPAMLLQLMILPGPMKEKKYHLNVNLQSLLQSGLKSTFLAGNDLLLYSEE
jgi:hypothetical protein